MIPSGFWAVFKEASSRQALPYPGPKLHQTRKLHSSTSSVMLATKGNLVRSCHVQSKTEWMIVLPHFSCHVVPPSQYIGKTVSVCVENKTTVSAEYFCRKELDFGIEVIGLHSLLRWRSGSSCPWTRSGQIRSRSHPRRHQQ